MATLCEMTTDEVPRLFYNGAMQRLPPRSAVTFGASGRARVKRMFSRQAFAETVSHTWEGLVQAWRLSAWLFLAYCALCWVALRVLFSIGVRLLL